jgi:hypothetical protein
MCSGRAQEFRDPVAFSEPLRVQLLIAETLYQTWAIRRTMAPVGSQWTDVSLLSKKSQLWMEAGAARGQYRCFRREAPLQNGWPTPTRPGLFESGSWKARAEIDVASESMTVQASYAKRPPARADSAFLVGAPALPIRAPHSLDLLQGSNAGGDQLTSKSSLTTILG